MSNRLFGIAMTIGLAIFMMGFPVDRAWAEKRVALVIGNSNYVTVPKLPNPSRDAISVGQMFRDAGFDTVDVIVNVKNQEFKRAIRKFELDADQADIAVIFYAGHGLEIGGTNYLIPVDATLASDRDADDEAITLERMVSSADGASKLRVIILDACRDNPFTTTMRRDRKGNRVVSSGLGKAGPTSTNTLIAYAANAGSTADDGSGEHSPFTSAILKNLTIPGLDLRLAFGRIHDEVMRATGSRQEPNVYGSLGGDNITLVPAPKVQDTPVADVRADYELVERIGTRKAWEVFVGTHKTGLYADLARVRIAALSDQQQAEANPITRSNSNTAVAGAPSAPAPGGRDSSSQEALDWNKIKDSSDPVVLQRFIQKYPDAPLAINAQKRLEILRQAAREREDAQKAAEQARIQAEQKKAELAAAKKREDDERRAKAAEAEQQAKAAAAELAAAKKREEDQRRAEAAEAAQRVRAADAERKAAEAKQKAEEAERTKAVDAAAAARAESERQAQQAEVERKKADQSAAREAICKAEQGKFDDLYAKGSDGPGVEKMKAFLKIVTCDRLSPQVATAIDKFTAEAAKRAAVMPNSPQLVRAAQSELARIGCVPGQPDGILNVTTKAALGRYMKIKGRSSDDVSVTEGLVSELSKQTDRVCPLECKPDELAKGDKCVAAEKPAAPAVTSRRKDEDDDVPARRKQPQPEKRQAEREPRKPAPAPEPHARQQATARPSAGAGGGGGHTMIGVGF